jgi:uncharacterized membrane protein YeaQ/YmgE (transglycosylase-associated protein family)
MAILNRLPILIWAGAALLGWIAGDVIATDPAIHPRLQELFAAWFGANVDGFLAWFGMDTRAGAGAEIASAVAGVIVVLVAGSIWRRRRLRHTKHATS